MVTVLTFLSWAMLVCCVSSQACDSGWFGTPNVCQYKCRCASGGCDSNGTCTSGGCQQGWFGPACQYSDLASSIQSAVTDGKDNTCLTSPPPGNIVRVNLNRTTTFTWLRIRVSDSAFLHRLTLQFNDNTSLACLNPRNASVDDTTLDVHCGVGELVTSLTLGGEGVSYLCSVYVSGGRNVALRQPTQQISTWSEPVPPGSPNIKYFPSNQSVDGDTSGDFFGTNSCSCTQPGENVPNWNVSFPLPRRVQRFALYGPTRGVTYRMPGFILQSFDAAGTMVFNYKDPHTASKPQPVYPVPMPVNVTSSVSLVNVISDNDDRLTQMCEVEVYGETVCGQGQYGRECERSCSCDIEDICFVSTGGCPSGCKVGFHGESCTLPCRPETYGLRCGSNCSQFCVKNAGDERSCDHVNGTCLRGCESGYQEPTCTEKCTPGFFGVGCRSNCSETCAQNVSDERSCDHINGTCLHGCTSGYTNATCSSFCSPGTYGQDCKSNCSHVCVATNKTDETQCDHISGWCLFGCISYDPQFCTKGPDSTAGNTNNGGDGNEKVIIGAVVGSVLGAIVVTLVIIGAVVFMRRRKNSKSQTRNLSSTDNSTNGSNASLSGPIINSQSAAFKAKPKPKARKMNGAKDGGNKTESSAHSGTYYNTLPIQGSTVVSLEELEKFMASRDKDFFKSQFSTISANEAATMNVGLSAENRNKNRYKNICAYDHSRVNLIPNVAKKHGDYINASYIEGYKSDEKFIASQGPTKTMLEDFVRMLWEQQVEKVVMLTNLVEDGKQKCEKYWPEEGEIKVGEITIKLTTTQVFADYTIRRLQLKKDGKTGQDLVHFHFTSWPDKDIPNTTWGLVDFEQRVASYQSSKPIVVHCSAGVGRTGTFIALRNVMRQAEETGQMDFFQTVQRLRQNRINMVQTVDQYIFLHRAAQVAMLCIGTTVTAKDIQTRINTLESKMGTGQTKMEKEFKSVCSACDDKEEKWTPEENPYTVYENSQSVIISRKNRDNSILPKELYRVKLFSERPDFGEYINAVLVPSFSKQNQQILTQLPLPATVADFWSMVIQYQVILIVAFDVDQRATDPTIADYLSPSDDTTSTLLKIKTELPTSTLHWTQQKIAVTMETGAEKLSNLTSTEQHVTHITSTSNPLDKRTQLALIQHVRSLQRSAGEGRTLYMCRNGATYSGLVCVLSLLLDRMDNDQCLTVPLVVGAIKAVRPEIIPTLEQYKLLYDVVDLYTETMSEYSNFGSSLS